ncbi:hypothetical protein TFLX_02072 [Thermoflexales bacterium]|nr:hypothetical protein TFLX_02072 [Thermoflexales bacterium]
MIKRTLILSSLILALPVLLVRLVVAQTPPPIETIIPRDQDRSAASQAAATLLNHTAEITFTPAVTVYLPTIFQNYTSCTTIPALLSPATGTTLNTLVPLFRWDSGNDPGATEFRYETSKDVTFDTTYGFRSRYDAQGIHEYRFSENFDPGTTYYWRAYLMCGEAPGPYTAVWTFTTGSGGTLPPGPNLVSPANGTLVAGTSVTLRWSPLAEAVEYTVYRKKAGSSTIFWKVNNTEFTLSGLSPNTPYEWWIKARNEYAWGAESPHWFFTTGPSGSVIISIDTAPRSCRSQRHAISTQDCLLEETTR